MKFDLLSHFEGGACWWSRRQEGTKGAWRHLSPTVRKEEEKMERLGLLVSLICVASASAPIDPRGTRPVEHGTSADKCATRREWPICTSDDWGPKCPSGCRIQGLMDKNDHSLLKRIEKIRSLLDQNKAKQRSTDVVSKQTYDYIKEKLILDSGSNNNYYDLAQRLRQRITDMKIKIDRQMRTLAAMKDRVKDQVVEMQRLEVDIDIKLRSCKGSCAKYSEHQVDRDSYVTLDKQIQQLDSQAAQTIESVGTLYVMKSRPLKDLVVNNTFKSKDLDHSATAAQQKVDVFNDVETVNLILEEEGSSSSPATISKVPVCLRLKHKNKDGRQLHGGLETRWSRRCEENAAMPLCSDQDWHWTCPSGCRLQGLISRRENDEDGKLWTACEAVKTNSEAAEAAMRAMAQIYSQNRRVIVSRYMSELVFINEADHLSGNLTLLRKRSSGLRQRFHELDISVRKLIDELHRAEVDIDMTLRSCSGSCRSVPPFAVDHLGYQTLRWDTDRLDKINKMAPSSIPRITLQQTFGPVPSGDYKSIPTVQRELLTQFEDIGQNRMVLEESGDGEANGN